MSDEKPSRKEMRNPDAFQRVSAEYGSKLLEHKKPILAALAALVVLTLVAGVVSKSSQRRAVTAGADLSRAIEATRQGVEGSLDPLGDPDLPKFPSAQAKQEEIVKRMEEVRTQHPGTDAARTATLYLADAQFQLGKYDEAAKSYDEFLAGAPGGDPMRVLALEGAGYVQEAKQAWDKALENFDGMGKEAAGEPAKARAAYHRARILELSGKKQDAADAFQKVKDEYKDVPAARLAGDRLALLATQGAVPAAKPAGGEQK